MCTGMRYLHCRVLFVIEVGQCTSPHLHYTYIELTSQNDGGSLIKRPEPATRRRLHVASSWGLVWPSLVPYQILCYQFHHPPSHLSWFQGGKSMISGQISVQKDEACEALPFRIRVTRLHQLCMATLWVSLNNQRLIWQWLGSEQTNKYCRFSSFPALFSSFLSIL